MDEQASIRDEPVLITPPIKAPGEEGRGGGGGGGAHRLGGIGVSCPGADPSLSRGRLKVEPILIRFPLKNDREPVRSPSQNRVVNLREIASFFFVHRRS